MSIWSMASNRSAWRGYEYFAEGRVTSFIKVTDGVYEGDVEGTAADPYHTVINTIHPRQSHCNCPFSIDHPNASCKHMVALLFTVFPSEADAYMHEVEESEREEERRQQAHLEELRKHVNSLSKESLRQELYNALLELEERESRYW